MLAAPSLYTRLGFRACREPKPSTARYSRLHDLNRIRPTTNDELIQVLHCFSRTGYVLSRTRRNRTDDLHSNLGERERFARQQEGHMQLHVVESTSPRS